MAEKADVVIIGAGVMGLAAAYELAKGGIDVLVVDQSGLADEASTRNPGGIRLLGRDEAEVPLMLSAMKTWHSLQEELQFDIGLRPDGYLWVALNDKEIKLQEDLVERDAKYGIDERVLYADELKAFAEAFSLNVVKSGLWSPGCRMANPFAVSMGYYRAAKRLGARFWFQSGVTDFKVKNGRIQSIKTPRGEISANIFVNAAGPWAAELAKKVGVEIPIKNLPYQIQCTEPVRQILPAFNVISSKGFLRQSPLGNIYTGNSNATGNKDSFDKSTDNEFMRKTLADFAKIVPATKSLKIIRTWVGIIDFTPDDNFIFGHVDNVEGLVLATGFSGHGFALAPVIGQLIAELIDLGETSLPTDAFHINRFKKGKIGRVSHFAHQYMDEI